jgi:sugar-specific transcriptional regulator TrmB
MNLNDVLMEIGLNQGESTIYLVLLRNGTLSVNDIKNKVQIHRPNIYDYLEKLMNKGLVNHVTINNIKHFTAVNPEKLVEFIEEKKALIKDQLTEFKKIQNTPQEEIKVEVYKGKEGIKTFLNDIIKVGKDYVSLGVDETIWEEKFSTIIKQHFRKEKEINISSRILTTNQTKQIYKQGNYKYIDQKYFSNNSTSIYGNKVCSIIWEPLTVIIITNNKYAEGQKKHFELLWNTAKTKNEKNMKIIE